MPIVSEDLKSFIRARILPDQANAAEYLFSLETHPNLYTTIAQYKEQIIKLEDRFDRITEDKRNDSHSGMLLVRNGWQDAVERTLDGIEESIEEALEKDGLTSGCAFTLMLLIQRYFRDVDIPSPSSSLPLPLPLPSTLLHGSDVSYSSVRSDELGYGSSDEEDGLWLKL